MLNYLTCKSAFSGRITLALVMMGIGFIPDIFSSLQETTIGSICNFLDGVGAMILIVTAIQLLVIETVGEIQKRTKVTQNYNVTLTMTEAFRHLKGGE